MFQYKMVLSITLKWKWSTLGWIRLIGSVLNNISLSNILQTMLCVEHPALKITDLHGEDIPGRTNTLSYCFSAILLSKLSDTISRYLFKIQNAGRSIIVNHNHHVGAF